MELEQMTDQILSAAIAIHREFGPGLMESVYEAILAHELEQRGFSVRRQQAVSLSFAGMEFAEAFRADLIVNDTLIIELKATARSDPVFARQLLTYLRLLQLLVGLVINFGAPTLKEGIKRVVNSIPANNSPRLRTHARATFRDPKPADARPHQKAVASLRESAPPREQS